MFSIKKIFNGLLCRSKDTSNSQILTEDKDIIIISVLWDCQTDSAITSIDARPYPADDPRMAKQAESLASILTKICNNNVPLTEMMINSIDFLKNQSQNNLLFYNNVLFFWKHFLSSEQKVLQESGPVIKPTQVFKH